MRDRTEPRDDGGREFTRAGDVFADRSVLTPSYVPDRLPERAAHRRSLRGSLTEHTGRTVAVIGREGQGKTTTVRQAAEHVDGSAVALSCREGVSVRALAVKLHNELVGPGNTMARTGHSEERACAAAARALRASGDLVALDDVEGISAGELERFVRAVTAPENPLVLVANSVQFRNGLARSFRTDVIDDVVVFGPYDSDELRQIVERRSVTAFRPDVVDAGAVDRIAAMGAEDGGNARVAIEILRHAGDVAVDRGDTTVGEPHVEAGRDRFRTERHRDAVTSLSAHERATLAALLTLTRDGETPSAVEAVTGAYRDTARSRSVTPSGRRAVRNYLATLREAGLLTRSETPRGQVEYRLAIDPSVLDDFDV
jgi:cell division control protein 6